MRSEEEYIREEVRRRKERARQSGIVDAAFGLFFGHFRHYDSWAKNCPELLHSDIAVTNHTSTKERWDEIERIEVRIRGKEYVFTFREHTVDADDRVFYAAKLHLEFQAREVMTLEWFREVDEFDHTSWRIHEVSAFIEGPWLGDLMNVFTEIKTKEDARKKIHQEQSKKSELEKLKRNFGL